jgi:hypothetical protein
VVQKKELRHAIQESHATDGHHTLSASRRKDQSTGVAPKREEEMGSFSNNQIRQERPSPFEKGGKISYALFRE